MIENLERAPSSESDSSHPQILIVSSSMDAITWQPVADGLRSRGYDVVAYEVDKVAEGRVPFSMSYDEASGFSVTYGGRELALGSIAAAWLRRPNMFIDDQSNRALQMTIDRERLLSQYPIIDEVPEAAWLNSPERMRRIEQKFGQLALAQEVGFRVPQATVSTNNWSVLGEKITPEDTDEVIYKPLMGDLLEDDKGNLHLPYTKVYGNRPSELPLDSNPYPGLWQPRLDKAREWRVTVVGEKVFGATIYTTETSSDDWRKHQASRELVRFVAEDFPAGESEKCRAYLRHAGLRFGAFDFIESRDGTITFLECNTNGQYGWLEAEIGLPITDAIIEDLAGIADEQAGAMLH